MSNSKCANTQKWIVSTNGPKKNKNLAKNQHVNSCARREAGVLELYESRILQQNKREREVKMHKLIVDDYIRVSKQYLPPSVSQNWFGEAGLLTLPGAGTSVQQRGEGPEAEPTPKRSKIDDKGEISKNKTPQTQQSSSSTSSETLTSNPPRRVAFIGDGNLVNGKITNIYVVKIIFRTCQVEKTMNKASNHILCTGCNTA